MFLICSAQWLDEVRSSPLDDFEFNIQEGLFVNDSPLSHQFTPSGPTFALFDPSQFSTFSASAQQINDTISPIVSRDDVFTTAEPQEIKKRYPLSAIY
jgi:hypothetical protein